MLNTCSIGRRWKPREGWSRPVLTGERGTLSNPFLCGGLGLVLWWFLSLDGKEHCFLVVTMTIPVKRLVVRVRCPVPGPPRSESVVWLVSVPPVRWFPSDRCIGFAVVMAQVRRPVPFRTRKLRPGRGDGTALERVWESSTPPHSTSGFPSSVTLREPPFLIPAHGCFLRPLEVFGRRKDCRREDSSIGWRFRDAGRPVGGRIPPPTGCFVPPEGPWAGGSLQSLGVPGRWGIPGIPGELPALIRWWNRLGNYALFRTQTLRRIEQNHVSRQSDGPAGRRPELA